MDFTIDAHHHLWRYEPAEYPWIGDSDAVIRRDFLPRDLLSAWEGVGVQGTVAVQARQTVQETEWLLEQAAENPFLLGVVGWAPLTDPDVAGLLDRFVGNPRFKGVRHVLQSESDDYLSRSDFDRGIAAVTARGLTYDLLIHDRQLRAATALADRHPHQRFILDHLAKPRIREGVLDPWRADIAALAQRPNVFCKVSGMVTEADRAAWTIGDLQPFFDTALEAFGPERLMFGSDWPVCLLAATPGHWHETVRALAADLSMDERASLFGRTAVHAYGLDTGTQPNGV